METVVDRREAHAARDGKQDFWLTSLVARLVQHFKKLIWLHCALSGRLEKVIWRNSQNSGDDLEPSRTDTVRALLVFLNLLEGCAQLIREFLLRQPFLQAKRLHALPNRDVQ
jgi:hypothetical protein